MNRAELAGCVELALGLLTILSAAFVGWWGGVGVGIVFIIGGAIGLLWGRKKRKNPKR